MARFEGISPFLAAELTARMQSATVANAWDSLFGAAKRDRWMPVLLREADGAPIGAYPFPTVQVDAALQHERDSINTALDHYYGAAMPRAALDAAVHELQAAVARATKSRERQRDSLLRSLAEAGRADENREAGELLLAGLHLVEARAEAATVPDLYSVAGGERTIALDPRKSARENAEAYFRRYRKAKEGAEAQRTHLARTEEELQGLRDVARQLPEAADLEAVKGLRAELMRGGLLRGERSREADEPQQRKGPDFGGKKIRAITTAEGWDIYVGENSEANDYLTSRVAGPNDLWFHVRAGASAHVVIRTRNDPWSVPHSVLQRAAMLAAQHSAAKHSSLVPVDYTLKKYVRRLRGSASGAALYQNEKTLYVKPGER
jgi:predicted ribosome quality control (RQC) complex YloA/Tae2 family protein